MPDSRLSLEYLEAVEQKFLGAGDAEDHYGWSPLPLRKFIELMNICQQYLPPHAIFLEAGCGIGTKLYVAREMYDMWEYGFDINADFIDHAKNAFGVRAYVGSVLDMPYDLADVSYIARPYKDNSKEVEYERLVHHRIRNGAILIAAYAAVKPEWHCLFRLGQHGAWKKPDDGKPVPRKPLPPHPESLPEYNALIRKRQPGPDPLKKDDDE
jgi:SAM-dependent methyltransferase